MKPCPYCAEEIQDAAVFCRHCRQSLSASTPTPGDTPSQAESLFPSPGPATPSSSPESWVPQLGPGTRLCGRYLLQALLGKGGMAEVWVAQDEVQRRRVAIKTIPSTVLSEVSGGSLVLDEALMTEANLLSELHHERTRAVYLLDVDRSGRAPTPFVVMELVQGASVATALRLRPGRRFSVDEVLAIGQQVCEALSYAHGKGVVHRDLKPGNLFLAGLSETALSAPLDLRSLRVKVMDFGLATRVRASVLAKSALSFAVAGTPQYMAPEQLTGRVAHGMLERVDVYGLGATLYELLSGRTVVSPEGDVALQILHLAPEQIDGCPEWLWKVVAACLAKTPQDRPASAEALSRSLSGGAVVVVEPQPLTPASATPDASTAPAAINVEIPPAPAIVASPLHIPTGCRPLDESNRLYPKSPHQRQVEDAKALNMPLAIQHEATGMPFVLIPRGKFQMGAVPGDRHALDQEKPQQEVTIRKAFYMGIAPVTVSQYLRFATQPQLVPVAPEFNLGWKNQDHPIVNVNWEDAKIFCEWGGLRLPSEAEWEFAARGGLVGMTYPWGDDEPSSRPAHNGARFGEVDGTCPVATFGANGFGLFDGSGNVWEWVADDWHDDYEGAPSNGSAWSAGGAARRVVRGGSWYDNPRRLRVSYRYHHDAGFRTAHSGFRCSRELFP